MELAAPLLVAALLCGSLGAGSAHGIVPSLLRTLLEGSAEQLRSGPMAQYAIDNATGAALAALKECIDELPPEHLRALVHLLNLVRTEA